METVTTKSPLEWAALWAAMKDAPHAWILTTPSMYDEMLGAVPPRAMRRGNFLVGEPDHHNEKGQPVYACFRKTSSRIHATYMSVQEFNEL